MPRDDYSFSDTLTGIQSLRDSNRSDDWAEWRRVVLAGLKSGRNLEARVAELERLSQQYARVGAYETIDKRLQVLERAHELRSRFATQFLKAAGQVALVAIAWALGHYLK